MASIDTVGSSPNNASSDQFTVTFSDFLGAVSGVSTASFVLAESGTASGSIASVSGSGDSYTVTVNSVTGDGTLGLNLISPGNGITDAAGNSLSAGFVGQTYTVEHTPPSVSSIDTVGSSSNNGGTEQFTVAFSEAVTGVTASDFALTDTGSVTGTIASISGSGSSYTVTVTGATGTGTMRLDLKSSGTGIAERGRQRDLRRLHEWGDVLDFAAIRHAVGLGARDGDGRGRTSWIGRNGHDLGNADLERRGVHAGRGIRR